MRNLTVATATCVMVKVQLQLAVWQATHLTCWKLELALMLMAYLAPWVQLSWQAARHKHMQACICTARPWHTC